MVGAIIRANSSALALANRHESGRYNAALKLKFKVSIAGFSHRVVLPGPGFLEEPPK